MIGRDEILGRVIECLQEALGLDGDEVLPEASLLNDLGADSLDFIDIVFRLESAFGIDIPRGELYPDDLLSRPEFVSDGKMTKLGLQEFRKRFPHADHVKAAEGRSAVEIGNLFTVDMLVRYLQDRLSATESGTPKIESAVGR